MVDRALFIGMSGESNSMQQLGLIANNLANANTVGFRADYEIVQSHSNQVNAKGARHHLKADRTYSDFSSGPLNYTGRDLDIAIEGDGFIAVQTKDGKQAYTRAGNLEVDSKGFLVTGKGDLVLGSSGVVIVPKAQRLTIDNYGQVAAQLPGQSEKDVVNLGKIKLVDVPINQLHKGADGLFYAIGEGTFPESDKIRLAPKTLEGSNVNTVKTMVDLITLSRQFEMHGKLMKAIEDNAARSNQLLDITK